ncbi:YhbD family protein [Fictibacillus sp. KIGAM418]|uniref:YhbD family protein n=1 Tax=Fictibacillus marinisediminis TaxID=2878389 RepID=A0A9X1X8Z9_9BACL|nr:YhbD family protein [Fictibacillus marinisediminis]MCK6256098.1 YhbD family protein [Fictibacillus marinisediminis]
MSNELISKKDLLDLAGISYGQLYRWKRKNLIPEEWFVRKSTFTGQETFFPKDKVLERIDKIQSMKETLSLDELAERFSPSVKTETKITKDELLQRNIVSKAVLDLYLNENGNIEQFRFDELLEVFILDKLLTSGDISLDEGKMLLQVLKEARGSLSKSKYELLFIRKLGVTSCLLLSGAESIMVDQRSKVTVRLSVTSCVEELKTNL